MVEKKYMICPVHSSVHMEKVEDGVILQGNEVLSRTNMFYCSKCNKYYFSTKYLAQDKTMKFKGKTAVNVTIKPTSKKSGAVLVADGYVDKRAIVLKPSEVVMYKKETTPVFCPNDNTDLIYKPNLNIVCLDGLVAVAGYYCDTCKKAYISKRMLDNIMKVHTDEFVVAFNTIKENIIVGANKKENIEKQAVQSDTEFNPTDGFIEDIRLEERKYKLEDFDISSDIDRKSIGDVAENLCTFDELEDNYDKNYPFSLLHYAFIFRRYDKVADMLKHLNKDEIKEVLHIKGADGLEWITPLVCAKWNLNYICSYDEKKHTKLMEYLIPYLSEVEEIDLAAEYDNGVNYRCVNANIFDLFFCGKQPLLDVNYNKNQELPSLQLENNYASIVINEKGSDKKIVVFYAIKKEIDKASLAGRKAKILIVCPYGKKEEWHSDLRHHMGRFGHIVQQEDMGEMYNGELKKVYFKNAEHNIFIAGQIQSRNSCDSELKSSLEYFSKNEQWDLVIIDDVHRSFENYKMIRALRALLITSQPIVIRKSDNVIRAFEDYKKLLCEITGKNFDNKKINPISSSVLTKKDIYVNWFKEDLNKVCIDKNIRFVTCKRHKKRQRIFSKIEHIADRKTALLYDQDDDFLFSCAKNMFEVENVPILTENFKLAELINVLNESNKSYIIFCEHAEVVNNIFNTLKGIFTDDIVASKKGRIEEVIGINNVYIGQLMDELVSKVRNGKRVFLITTEKFAGNEMDLTCFDGVIHYELPFTSLELEDRFGQMSRTITECQNKVMDEVFFLNECLEGQNDVEINRMLYYCMTKIDIACKYMPLRNIVFYYPKFIKKIKDSAIESLNFFLQDKVLSIENEQVVKKMQDKLFSMQKELKEEEYWKYINIGDLPFDRVCKKILEEERQEEVAEEFYIKIAEYMKYWESTYRERNEYHRSYKQFLKTEDKIMKWLSIIGVIEFEKNGAFESVFACAFEQNNQEIQEVNSELFEEVLLKDESDNNDDTVSIVHKRVNYMLDVLDDVDFYKLDIKNYLAEGLYFYKNGHIERTNVNNYRWK